MKTIKFSSKIAEGFCGIFLIISALASNVQGQVSFLGPELLGRPTDNSVTINVVANAAIEAYFQYGTQSGNYPYYTSTISSSAGEPLEVVLSGLNSNTLYYYSMVYRQIGASTWIIRDEHSFYTQRSAGSTFAFTITSDSHMNGGGGNVALYQQTLNNILNDDPDFHLDLGDTFWMDGVTSSATANQRYLQQRKYMGTISHSVPIFVSPGNHENEEGWNFDDTNSKALLSVNARKLYYPNPVTDGFYSGNDDRLTLIGGDQFREDYYAWKWGNALFVVIDPFQYTMTKPYAGSPGGENNDETVIGDRWDWTLGWQQYQWFKQTLEKNNDATFKFVFAHQMVGGSQDYVRGGAVPAHMFEWGGYNADGTNWGFDTERPGWDAPIRQIMIDNNVTAFFHGHDHQYAYEKRDGIVYQALPSAGLSGSGFNIYTSSDPYLIKALPSPGHIRITVSPSQVTVDYIATTGGTVNYSYTIEANSGNHSPVAYSQSMTTNEDTAKAITLTANDGDGDTLTYSIVTSPAHGTLSGTLPNVTYAPVVNYNGSDSFTFKANDGTVDSNVATVSVTVNGVNDAPVAYSQSMTTNQNTAKAIILTANDVDGNTLTYSIVTSPTHGTLSGTLPNVTYTPVANYSGSDSFTFQANDGIVSSNIATVSITVSFQPSNSNLALNKLATADSEQMSTGNIASKGNDGNSLTRWSANDGRVNHWWKVDLGATYMLIGTKVKFQFSRNYRYKIEVSMDNINWTIVANHTTTTNTAQTRQDSFSATPGRYVRITYTGLPWYPTTWASHYEFEVYGN